MSKHQQDDDQKMATPGDDHAAAGRSTEQELLTSIEALEQQIAELTDALQRERADAINTRRLADERLAGVQTLAKAKVVRELLPVIDNVERALRHVPKELEGNEFVRGVQALGKQFDKTLADLGVQKIKAVGEPFNPHLHEAVSMDEGDGDQEIVSEELQAGYQLGDGENAEVLRPAMVRVKAA